MPRLHLPSGARLAALVAATAALLAPTAALAHPLGNFTINHYAGIRVAPGEIQLDVVLDRAEIPTFEERRRLDADGDGAVSEKEAASARESECRTVAASLELTVDGERLELGLIAAGLSFPPGSSGLSTMRLVCGFVVTLTGGLGAGRTITFADRSFQDRLGWREIVLEGDAVAIESQETLSVSPSRRLTDYPEEMLASPLAMTEVSFRAVPGGPPRATRISIEAPIATIASAAASGTQRTMASAGRMSLAATTRTARVTIPSVCATVTAMPRLAACRGVARVPTR